MTLRDMPAYAAQVTTSDSALAVDAALRRLDAAVTHDNPEQLGSA